MQTLYTKITRERVPRFQQMTKIIIENGERKVCKSALSNQGNDHIMHMAKNYQYFKDNGKNILCPTEYKNHVLYFEFLKEDSFCAELLNCATEKKLDEFIELLYTYKNYVYNFGDEKELFTLTDEYREVFGNVTPRQTIGAKHLNIDLIFENIILRDKVYTAIDYEWIYDFVIPYEFVFYRAIYGLYIKNSKVLDGFINIDTIYDLFGITKEDVKIFEQMDQNFLKYVYGNTYNYDQVLLNYRKETYPIKELIQKTMLNTQLYCDLGEGYLEDQCIIKDIEVLKNKHVEISFTLPEDTKNIRFDPSTSFLCLYLDKVILIDNEGTEVEPINITTNAELKLGKYFMFQNEDPQIIINNIEETHVVIFQFKFLSDDISEINEFIENYDSEKNKYIRTLQEKEEENEQSKKEYLKNLSKKENEYFEIKKELNRITKMNELYLEMISELRLR